MAIKIGTAVSLDNPSGWSVQPDDRQVKHQIIDGDGVIVVDNGRFSAGDVYSFTVTFNAENWAIVKGYWEARTLVDVIYGGVTYASRRVLVGKIETPDKLFPNYYKVGISLWSK